VTETISSLEVPLPALEAFESRWRFRGGSEIREVFTPSLVPEEGDHYFPSRIGLAVLRVVAGAAGHGGGEPRAWRSGPAKWRERVRLGLG
jgi:hypothetical protein